MLLLWCDPQQLMGPGAAGTSARPAAWGDDSSDDELPLGARLKTGKPLVLPLVLPASRVTPGHTRVAMN